jgi:hypothetical protein
MRYPFVRAASKLSGPIDLFYGYRESSVAGDG